jgi:hypothetical protein
MLSLLVDMLACGNREVIANDSQTTKSLADREHISAKLVYNGTGLLAGRWQN